MLLILKQQDQVLDAIDSVSSAAFTICLVPATGVWGRDFHEAQSLKMQSTPSKSSGVSWKAGWSS